jgi:hypothetical protein
MDGKKQSYGQTGITETDFPVPNDIELAQWKKCNIAARTALVGI